MRTSHWFMVALALLCGAALAVEPGAAPVSDPYKPQSAPATDTAESAAEIPRPTFQALRQNEDWSTLTGKDLTSTGDVFDRLKYVPLSDNGSVWAGFGGQVRERYEIWNNFNFGAAAPGGAAFRPHDDAMLLSRLMFYGDLHIGQNFRVFAEGKSALATQRDLLGGNRNVERDELDLQNGFGDFIIPFGDARESLTLRGGRQELLFGKQRLVSPLDWTNTRRTFDGFSGIAKLGDWTVTGFWTRPVIIEKYEFNQPGNDQEFYGLYAAGKIPTTSIGLDIYWLGLNKQTVTLGGTAPAPAPTQFNGTAGDEARQTVGGRLWGKIEKTAFDYELEGAYQFGEVGSGDISAYMCTGQLGYNLADFTTAPRLFINLDYASGDKSTGGDVQTFNQLFPLGHAYFGWIDEIGRQNVIDFSTGLTLKPSKGLSVELQGHLFWRAESADGVYNAAGALVRNPGVGNSLEIGQEFDLLVKHQLDRHTELSIGYSHFFAGDFIEQTGAHQDIDFIYMAVQYTF